MDIEIVAPDHVTADFVGQPGERTFYIQAADTGDSVAVLLEKQQVAGLAQLLTEALAGIGAAPPTSWDVAGMRLREPVQPRWRAGAVGVGIDPATARFVIEVTELVPDDTDRQPEVVRLWLTEEQAALVAAHAAWAVAQGRPSCRLCGLPLDPGGHLCPRMNGDARAR